MEVDEEILDTTPTKSSQSHRGVRKRVISGLHRSLSLTRSKPTNLHREDAFVTPRDSQGSIILGNTQSLLPQIPESQLSYRDSQSQSSVQTPDSQITNEVIPGNSYFVRASQHLSNPTQRISKMTRSKTMPTGICTSGRGEGQLMAGGITMSEAFRHTVSPSIPQPQSTTDTPRASPDLRSLTRHASFGMGTTPISSRCRMKSLPFVPPFKKD